MNSSAEKLIHMANQMAANLTHMSQADAAAIVAEHINKFWDPRMRKGLLAAAQAGGTGFSPVVKEAAVSVRPPKA